MFHIGASLAAARQAQGLSLADVEALSAIRVEQLEALEDERFETFPARAYCRAFIRTYARTLDLDADAFVAEFEEQVPPDDDPLPFVVEGRRVPSTRVVAAVLAVAAILGGALLLGTTGAGPRRAEPPRAPVEPRALDVAPFRPPDAIAAPMAPAIVHPPLVIRAVRGPCWLEARLGGSGGRILFEGMVEPGVARRFGAPKVWVRFGAPRNVTASRGNHSIEGLSGASPIDLTA